MRIDLYASGETAGTTEAGKSGGVGSASGYQSQASATAVPDNADRTTLSSSSLSVSSLTSQALASGSQRSERVESLRQSVSSGDYQLEPDAIAQSILKDRA